MIHDWLAPSCGPREGFLHRLPAGLKLGFGGFIIVGTVLAPLAWWGWFTSVGLVLAVVVVWSGIPLGYLGKRLVLLSPFVLGVALVNAFQPVGTVDGRTLALRSFLCLLTVLVVSNLTPFSHVLEVMRKLRIPLLLVTTLALMQRYLFVLVEETGRMQRARASRTFVRTRARRWQVLATVASQLFVRASERAERIYDAMCARGWK